MNRASAFSSCTALLYSGWSDAPLIDCRSDAQRESGDKVTSSDTVVRVDYTMHFDSKQHTHPLFF